MAVQGRLGLPPSYRQQRASRGKVRGKEVEYILLKYEEVPIIIIGVHLLPDYVPETVGVFHAYGLCEIVEEALDLFSCE